MGVRVSKVRERQMRRLAREARAATGDDQEQHGIQDGIPLSDQMVDEDKGNSSK